ncbi:hydroxyisourate hydrolase [Streptosporangium sandarakinum]|uniref:5-hydroxyisourate hydrolase n=1 Tax=Streptosporangium sandarakinum TaxID=1260955 RepID=A0A852USE8_9ACTN|nr:hydroxyisourate hydrolase [Streptosporangium sandarakinum]NYF38193.1 5-hydroxyisourate hydrolase [Streptosporangium sandarakinum]
MGIAIQTLDGVYGRPAASVRIRLECADGGHWNPDAKAETDHEGRVQDWKGRRFERGVYRLILESDRYFVGLGLTAAYSEIVVLFRMHDETDSYQIQVQLSPYSYSTYFGSFG